MTGVARTSRVRARTGLTLVELLVALAITVVTGMAIATVTVGVARGLENVNTARSALQRAHAAYIRLRAYTDPSLCILAEDSDRGFALWLDDGRPNSRVNLSELRVFWFNEVESTMSVERVVFPEDWPAEEVVKHDQTLSVVDDPFALMEAQRALGYTWSEVLADGVGGFGMTFESNNVLDANRVRLALTVVLDNGKREDLMLALGLPNHRTPE